MTAPLTPKEIQELRDLERRLLGERPQAMAVAVSPNEDRRPPWLRGRELPSGLHGWLGATPAKPAAPAPVAEAAATSWPEEFPDPKEAIRSRFEPRKLQMTVHDRDAPMMIMITHRAHPGWDRARIGQSLGLPDWYISLVLASRCRVHANHVTAEGALPALGAESDSGWRVQGEWLVRMVVGKPTRR